MALSDLFSRRRKEHAESDVGASDAPVHPTKVLARFIAGLSSRSQPVLLDLGPVVGTNVSFFGEQLGCKIFVENIYAELDRHVREGRMADLPAFLARRFPQHDSSIDGILCWDVIDYLDRASALALAAQLTRVLRAEGTLLAEAANRNGGGAGRAKAEPIKTLGAHPTSGGEIKVMPGRYGPYVTDGITNATLPRDVKPEDVTEEQAIALIDARAAKGPAKKKGRRKAPAKKAK